LGGRAHRLRLSHLQGAGEASSPEEGPRQGTGGGRAAAVAGQAGAGPDRIRGPAPFPGQHAHQRAAGGAGHPPFHLRFAAGDRTMKPLPFPVVLLLGVLLATAASAELVDRIAAIVNNEVITLSEVERRAAPELARVDQDATAADRAQKRATVMKKALDQLIDERLVDNELRELKVSITDKDVDTAVDEVKKNYNLTEQQLTEAVAKEGYT